MAGYFGTQRQQDLQAQAEKNVDLIKATPGACQNGRMIGVDDLDALGWDRIDEFLARDGVCGFRLIPAHRAGEIGVRLAERNCRFDTWDLFLADRTSALDACEPILAAGLPDGLSDLDQPTDPEGDDTARIQALIAEAGVVPFSGSFLVGACGPAVTMAVGDQNGEIVAAAHGYMPHNAHSPYPGHGWGGLVAVAGSQQGKGLGKYINARVLVGVLRDLGATHVYELISATNLPSRRMAESCGLRHEPGLVCGIAAPTESGKFTR
ncbi:GNAT family N-acetyltransferase [Flaviflagellibacter deserti]|uniref:GNAT family N-acetyltransferase n=1 Tax=Flaviflagellibacter deserti TaxID=2267266 RepID=A0ABV9YXJ7_9HYPH